MTPAELKSLFRQYVDEPDQTFMTSVNVEDYLRQGYREFRQLVMMHNPSVYSLSATVAVSGDSYDLSSDAVPAEPVTILGSLPSTGRRLMMLLSVIHTTETGDELRFLKAATSRRALQSDPDSYFLDGSLLRFSERQGSPALPGPPPVPATTRAFEVSYVPESDVDWNAGTYVDDLADWHDLIALYATRTYLIRDQGQNPMLLNQIMVRERDFIRYIQERDVDAPGYVNEIYHAPYETW
ncbi:hypothetical protein [uncultured Mediterranean phage]|nr:hypothetical protein [uncultured Mediterranean phage]